MAANELPAVQQVANESGLLAPRATAAENRLASAAFTVKVAQRLKAKGWALVRADPPAENVNGVRIDKIINRQDLEIVDIVSNADAAPPAERHAVWQVQGIGVPGMVVDPPDASGGSGGNGGSGDDGNVVDLERLIGALLLGLDSAANEVRLLREEIAKLRAEGVRLRLGR